MRPREDEDSAYAVANEVRNEYVLRVTGEVVPRSEGTVNPDLPTGEVELIAERVEVLNTAKTPPFAVNEDTIGVDELVRMRYRYIDIRRPQMLSALELRAGLNQEIRNFMTGRGFLEVETPILVAATPEGARDYVVPSRLQPGAFYALPQAPQQYKQLLMVAGVERYYQIARCFRDEDLRADRQPEFTQLDLEWSSRGRGHPRAVGGPVRDGDHGAAAGPDRAIAVPEADLAGVDGALRVRQAGPALRAGAERLLRDRGAVGLRRLQRGGRERRQGARDRDARWGVAVASRGECVHGSGSDAGRAGLVSMQFSAAPAEATEDEIRSPVLRHVGLEDARAIGTRCGAGAGDLVLLAAGEPGMVATVLDGLRRELARRLELVDPTVLQFGFITDFPLVESAGAGWNALHHPFTAPQAEDLALLESEPGKVRARAYEHDRERV